MEQTVETAYGGIFSIHDVLGVIGFAGIFFGPVGVGVSIVCDVADAVLYFREEDPVRGALALVCAIPGIGDAIGAVRSGTKLAKAAKAVGNAIRMTQKLYVTAASAQTALELAGDAKMEYAVNGGQMTSSVAFKELGAAAVLGLAALSGKSLMKDVSVLSKAADIRFKTTKLKKADAVSGKTIQYGGVGGCFTAGTKVKTADGDKNIEDVEAGDYVLAEDPETGEQEYKKVARTFIHVKYVLVHVTIEGKEIETTIEHPFYVEGEGFISAGELKAGDIIRTADGENLPIDKIEELEEPVLVYNFEVEDFHTYYVSELGVLVHNMCPKISWEDAGKGGSDAIKPFEVTTYESFNIRSVVGDGIEGHEMWQHANLKHNGYATTRMSTAASKNNPVMALPHYIHVDLNRQQYLFDGKNQTPFENIIYNANIMYNNKDIPNEQVTKQLIDALKHLDDIGGH